MRGVPLPDVLAKGAYRAKPSATIRAHNLFLVEKALHRLECSPSTGLSPLTILEAVENPAWFGPCFEQCSWDAWKVFLAALFGLPMTDQQAALFRQFSGRQMPPTRPAREAWVIVGRRGGKSSIAALIATYLAVCRDYTPYLARGEVATLPIIATDRAEARHCMRYIKGFTEAIPEIKGLVKRSLATRVEFNNRVVIEIHTSSFRSIRGYTFVSAICDEIGFWYSDKRAVNHDKEIIRALKPGMLTIPGAMLIALSSPHLRRGLLFENYEQHFGRDDDRILVWKAATLEMNPTADREAIEKDYADDYVAASAEYGAEFRDEG
jgi:hypothetical protein